MQVFRYSGPEFNPYDDSGDDSAARHDHAPGPWLAPAASGSLAATVPLPGSKSLTNRELVLFDSRRTAVSNDDLAGHDDVANGAPVRSPHDL